MQVHRGSLYLEYVRKAGNKDRTQAEVDKVLPWLTGYTTRQIKSRVSRWRAGTGVCYCNRFGRYEVAVIATSASPATTK